MDERTLEKELEELDKLPQPLKIPAWFRKVSVFIISVTLLYLLVIYFIPSTFVIESIAARSAATQLQNNQLIHDKGIITFENNSLELLQVAFKTSDGNEIKACLQGNKNNNIYTITNIFFPEILYQDFRSVRAKRCPQETLIDLHSHPSGRCFFSPHDIAVYDKRHLIAIMCNLETFHLYGWKNS